MERKDSISKECQNVIQVILQKQTKYGIPANEIQADVYELHAKDLAEIMELSQLLWRLDFLDKDQSMDGAIQKSLALFMNKNHEKCDFKLDNITKFNVFPFKIFADETISSKHKFFEDMANDVVPVLKFLQANLKLIDYFTNIFFPSCMGGFLSEYTSEIFIKFITNVYKTLSNKEIVQKHQLEVMAQPENFIYFIIQSISSFVFCDITFIQSFHNMLTHIISTNKECFLSNCLSAFYQSIPYMLRYQQKSLLLFREWFNQSEFYTMSLLCTIIKRIVDILMYSKEFYESNRLIVIDNVENNIITYNQDFNQNLLLLTNKDLLKMDVNSLQPIQTSKQNEFAYIVSIYELLKKGVYHKLPDYSVLFLKFNKIPNIIASQYDLDLITSIESVYQSSTDAQEFKSDINNRFELILYSTSIFSNLKSSTNEKPHKEKEIKDEATVAFEAKMNVKWNSILQKSIQNGTNIFSLIPKLKRTGEASFDTSGANQETLFLLNKYKELLDENENTVKNAVGSLSSNQEGFISPKLFSTSCLKELNRLISALCFKFVMNYVNFEGSAKKGIETFNTILENEVLMAYLKDFSVLRPKTIVQPNKNYVSSLLDIIRNGENFIFKYIQLKNKLVIEHFKNRNVNAEQSIYQIQILHTFIIHIKNALSIHFANSLRFTRIPQITNINETPESYQPHGFITDQLIYWPFIYEAGTIIDGLTKFDIEYNYGSICLLLTHISGLIFPIIQRIAKLSGGEDEKRYIDEFIRFVCNVTDLATRIPQEKPSEISFPNSLVSASETLKAELEGDDESKCMIQLYQIKENHFRNVCKEAQKFINMYSQLSLREEKTLLTEFFSKFL